jgi:hypothetical protein
MAAAQAKDQAQHHEQWHFSTERQITAVEKPAEIPVEVLGLLRTDDIVLCEKSCLKEVEAFDQIPASWFVASEVHLDGSDEVDLIILPNRGCLLGANIGPFWIARKADQGYRFVLSWVAHDLDILPSRTKGYHDVRFTSSSANMISTVLCKFDGHKYRPFNSDLTPVK